jgi:type II secretory pathway pseudopilin PulG
MIPTRSRPRRVPRAGAFTLLEVLLAIALILIIVTAAGTLLVSVAEARESLERYTLQQTATDGLLSQLESDLLCAVAGDGAGGPGVVGTAQGIKLLTRGRWLGAETPGASDLCRVEAAFAGNGVTLSRRAAALETLAPDGDGVTGAVLGVRRVEFWYHDGKAWKREFNSVKDGGLPRAVEVRLWFGALVPSPGGPSETGAPASAGAEVDPGVDGDAPVDVPPDRRIVIAVPDGGVNGGGP